MQSTGQGPIGCDPSGQIAVVYVGLFGALCCTELHAIVEYEPPKCPSRRRARLPPQSPEGVNIAGLTDVAVDGLQHDVTCAVTHGGEPFERPSVCASNG